MRLQSWVAGCWFVLCWSCVHLAHAQPSPAASQARAAFQRGVDASHAGDWESARREFEASRRLIVKPSTLFNLAVADLKLGLADEALEALTAFERSADPAQHVDMLARAKTLRAEAERTQETQKPATERVRTLLEPRALNKAAQREFERGREAFAAGEDKQALEAFTAAYEASQRIELLYDIGVVADRLRDDARAVEAFRAFVAQAPELPEATLAKKRLARLEEASRAQGARQPVAVTEQQDSLPAPSYPSPPASRAGPRTLIALGGVLAAASIGGALWWGERKGAWDQCHRPTETCDNEAQIERQRRAATGLTLSLDLAAVVLVASGVVWLRQRKHQIQPQVGPGKLAVTMRFTF